LADYAHDFDSASSKLANILRLGIMFNTYNQYIISILQRKIRTLPKRLSDAFHVDALAAAARR
jgi:hypothetical protein